MIFSDLGLTEKQREREREMGRAPCCDKANVKKGPWSPEEDAKLKAFIEQYGTGGNWIALPQKIGAFSHPKNMVWWFHGFNLCLEMCKL